MDMATKTDKTMNLSIDGMSCGSCVTAVSKALSAVPGVKVRSVAVGSAEIEVSDSGAAGKAMAVLQEAGYPARAMVATDTSVSSKPAGGCCGGASKAGAGSGADLSGSTPKGGCCG